MFQHPSKLHQKRLVFRQARQKRIAVFEEFANGGLAILKEEFAARNCNLDGLLVFIETQIASASAKPANLKISI